ncbi:hypothetical protein H9Q74_005454 [Fusarium xylarioides]|nr:hypothetical protein H9Q71_005448 [Fusarium xylarioides]KAG5824472.1 hypothetical protein H9Q74_005454 [Fusarium xylarioides]
MQAINNVEVTRNFSIEMLKVGDERSGFRIKNAPNDRGPRREVIQRTGHGVAMRCDLLGVAHGEMSVDSEFWASLLVFEFRFDPEHQARRLSEVTLQLLFETDHEKGLQPEVEAVSFDGKYSFLPSRQAESSTTGTEGGLAAGFGVDLSVGQKWEKTISRETTDETSISGGKWVPGNLGPNRIAKWTLLENKTLKTGVPATIRVAVRVQRRDQCPFKCIPTLECKADFWTSVEMLFGRLPEDDPILLDPKLGSMGESNAWDLKELGSIDLQRLSDVTFTTMILDTVK